jgi:NTE family protein
MLFHLGVLWRLNELGYLPRLDRISSVSGGSITSAFLGLRWKALQWNSARVATNFLEQVVSPLRDMAGETIDADSIASGALLPFVSISERVEREYREHLFGDATLQDLPAEGEEVPQFVINATNVQTGAIWRFSRKYMADWRVGRVDAPRVKLAFAVTASSAFPPFLSPAKMRLKEGEVQPTEGADLHREPYTTRIVLSDGGVYDNLGLETVWKRCATVLVSDGGGQMEPEEDPADDWVRHGVRTSSIIDNQVRSLRKRQVVGSFVHGLRRGAYWRIRGRIEEYPAKSMLPCPYEKTAKLARLKTRLAKLEPETKSRLINWGYALADAGVRSFVDKAHPAPTGFPYPEAGVG